LRRGPLRSRGRPAGRHPALQLLDLRHGAAGEDRLATYAFGARSIHHRFCTVCGIKPFGLAVDGSGVAVSIACLEGLDPEQRAALPVRYVDGAHDRWDAAPAVTGYL
jgi:hypothetical protein